MPPPSNENDLKRRARRRLIGAVALTLLAVIVLPLLLEDEPPPASSLAVKMAVLPAAERPGNAAPSSKPEPVDAPAVAAPRADETEPVPAPAMPPKPALKPDAPKPEFPKPAIQPEPPKPPAKADTVPGHPTQATVSNAAFVVQLAALSDSAKAQALKTRAAKAGLPAYTDAVGKLTRVRVGPYSSREAAVAAAVKLAENGMAGQVLAK